MRLICPRCQTTNESDAHFCKVCGTGFNVKPLRQNSATAPILIITAVVAVCGFCGIFGLLTGNKNEVAVNTDTATAKNFTGGSPSATASPASTRSERLTDTTKTNVSAADGAIVISEHARLRQTPDAHGTVIETLARNAETEVVRQKGAWFYVRAAGKTGWLHGNTIRLATRQSSEVVKKAPATSRPTRATDDESSEVEETDSDAENDRVADSSRYITGPRGGCYYIKRNGNKTYVDRSMCGGTSTGSESSSSGGGYLRGPRGGCYYINRNGNKTYVDRSLCN